MDNTAATGGTGGIEMDKVIEDLGSELYNALTATSPERLQQALQGVLDAALERTGLAVDVVVARPEAIDIAMLRTAQQKVRDAREASWTDEQYEEWEDWCASKPDVTPLCRLCGTSTGGADPATEYCLGCAQGLTQPPVASP
jgi:hypothetical protein